MTLEPEPGVQGDPKILADLAERGMRVEPVEGTIKMRISVGDIEAKSAGDAGTKGLKAVRRTIPKKGYVLADVTAALGPETPPGSPTPTAAEPAPAR